jgi:hypothetical protein
MYYAVAYMRNLGPVDVGVVFEVVEKVGECGGVVVDVREVLAFLTVP